MKQIVAKYFLLMSVVILSATGLFAAELKVLDMNIAMSAADRTLMDVPGRYVALASMKECVNGRQCGGPGGVCSDSEPSAPNKCVCVKGDKIVDPGNVSCTR